MRYLIVATVALLLGACGNDTGSSSTASAEPISGEKAFAVCANCHSRDAKIPGRSGPQLQDVIGRKAGSVEGFAYSPAMKNSGITWDAQTLDTYLAGPTKVVPGSRMTNVTADPARRQAIIEYLASP